LEVALQLESFAHRCSVHINEIETQVSYAKQFQDDSGFASLTPVTFEFSPEPDWTELPIDFTAKIKVLPKQFADSNKWILEAYEYWADTFDALDLDVERLAFYGKKACEEAVLIREKIGAGDGQMHASIANFEAVFRARRKRLKADEDAGIIPELKELFESEQSSLLQTFLSEPRDRCVRSTRD
jgi:hypothetical protein